MSERGADWPGTGPIDTEILDRIATRLNGSQRFTTVTFRPPEAPNSVVADLDTGYYPSSVEQVRLHIRWFETDDFSVHYTEQYSDGSSWECRWDRHPNEHNTRDHVHPPPDARTPGEDTDHAVDWRDVLASVLDDVDERRAAFWE